MRKLSFALLVALLAAALILSAVGCGKSKDKSANSAKAILLKSQKALLEATSVKVNGSVTLKTPEAEEKVEKETFTGEFNIISTTDVEGHMVAQDQQGKQSEAYIKEGYAYSYSPNSGWEKQKVQGVKDLTTGVIDPGNLATMIKYAENLKKLPDEGDNYVVSFDVGNKFYEEILKAVGEESSAPTTAEQSTAQEVSDLLKGVIGDVNVSMVMKINKTTSYPSEATVKATAKDIPMMGDVSLGSKMVFSDYNVPVTITVPPEALNAREVESGLPSGIPGLPGLGF
jgi:Family of unknown function (DUF6612)